MGKKRRWDRSQYPDDWEEISRQQRESTDWTCEFCGAEHGGEGTSKSGCTYSPVRLAAAHKYPNDTSNPDPELYSLCQSCHFSYDAQFRGIIEEGKHQARLHEILLEEEEYCYTCSSRKPIGHNCFDD